jgi:hypothetical protein
MMIVMTISYRIVSAFVDVLAGRSYIVIVTCRSDRMYPLFWMTKSVDKAESPLQVHEGVSRRAKGLKRPAEKLSYFHKEVS